MYSIKFLEGFADEKWQREEETYQTGKSKTKIRNSFVVWLIF